MSIRMLEMEGRCCIDRHFTPQIFLAAPIHHAGRFVSKLSADIGIDD